MRVSLFDRMEEMGAYHGAGPDDESLKEFKATIANVAKFSTEKLLDITNVVADIYTSNGFEGIFTFSIVSGSDAYSRSNSEPDEFFLALVNENEYASYYGKDPGHSVLEIGGQVSAWNGRSFSSYVNAGILKSKNGYGSDWNYAIGYTVAHELLHQLLQKSDLAINNKTPYYTSFKGHDDGYPNLNSTGSLKMTQDAIKEGRESCSGCLIILRHKILIQRYRLSK